MPKVTFIDRQGNRQEVEVAPGATLLDAARGNDIDIEGACEGSLSCATCHVIVDPAYFGRLPAPGEEEKDMFDLTFGLTATSRLGCQIVVSEELDGLTVAVPQPAEAGKPDPVPAWKVGGLMTHWTDFGVWNADDVHWDRFDGSRVDPDILKLVKAASLVEFNAPDYAAYLCNVFHDDLEFQKLVKLWREEEVKHGRILAKYARLADPDFDFDTRFKRYKDGFHVPVEVSESVRGSLTGEILARCVVETGTSSHYTAIRRATDEPLLHELCRNIAADELRHYKTFWEFSKVLREREGVGLLTRARVVFDRVAEAQDEELAYAYHSANERTGGFEHKRCNAAYVESAYKLYPPYLVERIVAMLLNVIGLEPHGRLSKFISWWTRRKMQKRDRQLAAVGG